MLTEVVVIDVDCFVVDRLVQGASASSASAVLRCRTKTGVDAGCIHAG